MFKNIEWCCQKQIKPLYNNIKYKDYFEPLKRFSEENDNIYKNILKNNIVDDTVIQYYIKSTTDISILVLFPNALKHPKLVDKMIKELEKNGDIHYTKEIEIDYYMAYNLCYQLYASEKRMKKNIEIIYKIERLGFKNDGSKNKIKIIVYTLINKTKPINGKSAEFKMELRDIFVQEDIKTTIFDSSDDRYPRGYDYLHVSDDINQSYEYSGIFFHENSLKFLRKQKSWRMLYMHKTWMIMNKAKNFFYDYSQNEFEKLMIFSSGVLYSYGVREANDLDCILLENKIIKPEDIDRLNSTKEMDISYKGTKEFNDIWAAELNNRAILFGAKNYKELIINPKYYYYFMGFKIIRLKYDLQLRFKRGRPAQLTDLLVIRQMFNFSYKLKIPETTTEYNEEKGNITSPVNKEKYLDTMKYYLKKRYYINLNIEQIEQWLSLDYEQNQDSDSSNDYTDLSLSGGYLSSKSGGDFSLPGAESLLPESSKINLDNFIKLQNEANEKYIYPKQEELLKLGYIPNTIIYSSNKPYLYPGENFEMQSVTHFCNKEITEINQNVICYVLQHLIFIISLAVVIKV